MNFQYNSKAHYAPSGGFKEEITGQDLSELRIVVQDDNQISTGFDIKLEGSLFAASTYRYMNHGDFYDAGGFQSARSAYNMQHDPLKLWDTQLNFAVHCATSALGVSVKHLNAKQPLVRALYRFHVYYHVRRILRRIIAPLPNEENFDKYNNSCSKEEAIRVANEYGTSRNFHIYAGRYYYWKDSHASWSKWIRPDSQGFTKAGLEKISESIRAYTYLVLTSQAGARHGILGNDAEAIVAQRLFHDNLSDVINKSVSLQDDVSRYQNTLKYARSSLDYSVGKGLYMLPSDMLLKPLNQVIDGYNDKIVINKSGFNLGKAVLPKPSLVFLKKTPQSSAKKNHLSVATVGSTVNYNEGKAVYNNELIWHNVHQVQSKHVKRVHTLDDHEDEKTAIILGISVLTLFWWWIQ